MPMLDILKKILRPLRAIFGPRFRGSGGLVARLTSLRVPGRLFACFVALGLLTQILSPYYVYSLFLICTHSGQLKNSGPGPQLLDFWSSQLLRCKVAARGWIYRPNYIYNRVPAGPVRSVLNVPFLLGIYAAFYPAGPLCLYFLYFWP